MSTGALDEVVPARGPTYPIESVDNVLRLIVLITERKQIRVSEAASELGTAVSTAHRLLAMLVHHGFASQDPTSKVYRVGQVLLRAGLVAARDMEVRTLIQPYLEQLRDETGETAHAAVLQGDQMLFIACAESPNALRVASRVGTLMWAHCTSIGKAWLACESDDFLRGLYPSPTLPALTDQSITSRAALMTELNAVRRAGFARNDGESEVGVGSVSAALSRRDGRPLVSVSVSVPLVRMPEHRWHELVESLLKTKASAEVALP
jgi:IclR family acetate operon transcriptional repressor